MTSSTKSFGIWHSPFQTFKQRPLDTSISYRYSTRKSTMVRLTKQAKIPGGIGGFVAVSVGTLFVLGMLFSSQNVVTVAPLSMMPVSFDAVSNGIQLKTWRQKLRDLCTAATSADDVKAIEAQQISGFALPVDPPPQPRGDAAIRVCKSVVMDFGANIGDTSGHAIDVGLISCNRNEDLKAFTPPTHFNVQTKEFELVKKRNILTTNMAKLLEMQATNQNSPNLGPEDYCYYGVEGNPHFTQRLRGIEDFVMAIRPRPIQHMHFFTESVGAGQDGMTKLYLDTVNDKQNFWGSSIFKDHQDVRKSVGEGKDAETVAAPVMGYTIGALMRKTLKAFDPLATAEEKKGGHLILKVDIEGGEYPLMAAEVEAGTLCEFIKMGNSADLFIEFHSQRVTGKHEFLGKSKDMQKTLADCGVTFRNLEAWWA
jgi:hypothetical protein